MTGAPLPDGNPSLEFAHYHVHRRPDGSPWVLGVGGMGVTYRAVDTRLHVDVALKVIHPARISDQDAQKLFVREARAAARVFHPNVSPVVFLNDEPGRVFYAMEFVDGVSVYAWLRKHGRPRVPHALGIAEQIAAGLGAIHEQHLVHRDLKPANLMVVQYAVTHPRHRSLTSSGGCMVKIIDFGLAKGTGPELGAALDPAAPLPTMGFRGTVAYASPEQCEESTDLDGRSDLYSLGCILWELLTGRPPFVGKNHRELLNQQVAAPPPWADLKSIQEPVVAVLRRLLAKNREQRFADAGQAVEALAEARRECREAGLPMPLPGSDSEWLATAPTSVTPPQPSGGVPAATPAGTSITLQLPPRWWLGALAIAVLGVGLIVWSLVPRGVTPSDARKLPDAAPTESLSAEAAARRRIIAVLPFSNLSGDKENEYFAEGVHEDILTSLAKVRELRVISRASVQKFKGRGLNIRDLARELGVGTVLEGSVRRLGNRVRVTTQLVDAATDQHLWAETYDRDITDVFEIQAAVAKEIAAALAMTLSQGEQKAIARQPTKSREAYDLFLRARSLQTRGSGREQFFAALELHERAVAIDPQFALAYAMIARLHCEIVWWAVDSSPGRMDKARAAANRAAELQPELPEAHVALGEILYRSERDYEGALREYRTALAIAPSNPIALEAAGLALRRLDRWEEALKYFRQAVELSPEDPHEKLGLAEMLFQMRRFAEAEPIYRKAVELSGNVEWQIALEACVMERTGDHDEFVRKARELIPKLDEFNRWMLQWEIRDFRGALETLRGLEDEEVPDLIASAPKSMLIAQVQRSLGARKEASELFEEAAARLAERVQKAPSNPFVRMKYSVALAGSFQREAGLREGEAALALTPESKDTINSRHLQLDFAEVCAELGETERACEILERLLRVEIKLTRLQLRYSPRFDVLRGYPRFEKLIAGK